MSLGSDPIALDRYLLALQQRLEICESALGITPDNAENLPNDTNAVTGRVYTIAQAAAATAIGTNAAHLLQESITIPANVLRDGTVLDISFVVQIQPQNFAWSFAFDLFDGSNAHAVCDAHTIAATPTPTAAGMIACARCCATVRAAGNNRTLETDSFVAWHFPGGTTNQTSGVAASSAFTGLPTVPADAPLNLEPRLTVTGATAGDTAQLLGMVVRVLDPTPQLE